MVKKSVEINEEILLDTTVEDLSNYDSLVLWKLKLKLKEKGEDTELIDKALELKKKREKEDKKDKKGLKAARLFGAFMGFFDN